MAKQKSKPAQRQPITANPLFPAVVALWFGALFGLGSLAVRPTLIEDLVLSSRIDLLIPAAAPPLGMTARIMLALIMAVIGAVIGVVLARRLTRPKPENRERSRTVFGQKGEARTANRARDAHPDAPSCQPISMRDIDPDGAQAAPASLAADNAIAGRRRGLTVDHGEEQFVPHEFAPLPGGGQPEVLDLARVSPPMVAPLSPAVVASESVPAMPPTAADAARQVFQADAAPAVQPGFAQPAMPAPEAMPVPAAQVDAPVTLPPESAAAHADGRQVFGMEPVQPAAEQPRQIFGQAIEGDHVASEFVREAGFKTTVFEQELPEPLFNRDVPQEAAATPAPTQPAGIPAAMPEAYSPLPPAPSAVPGLVIPAAMPEPAAIPAPMVMDAPAMPAPFAAATAAVEPVAPVMPAAVEAPLPSPAGLAMVDLASRLAESMRRRRAARGEAVSEPAAPAAPALQNEVPFAPPTINQAMPAIAPEPAPMPHAFASAPQVAATPQTFEPAPVAPAMPQAFAPAGPAFAAAAPVPQAFAPQGEAPQPAAFAPPASEVAAPPPVVASAALPNALRPLALDAFLEEDAAFNASLLPPRHIAAPPVQAEVTPAPQAAAAPAVPSAFDPVANEPAVQADAVQGEEAVAEENYASLLGIGPARAGFVRIEEPEADLSAPEPVVIFPGQAPSAPAPFAQGEANAFRRFDSPSSAGAGQAVDMGSAPPAVPATEAEQALRSALASLQRISGAA